MKQVKAVVENGCLRPEEELHFPDGEKLSLVIYSENELENIGWLKLSETAFAFWNSKEDDVWDSV